MSAVADTLIKQGNRTSDEKPGGFSLMGEIRKASDIPSVLGGTSNEVHTPRPVLHRVARLHKKMPEQIIESLICVRCVQYQALLATAHGVTYH